MKLPNAALAATAIVLVGLNMRTAVVSASPIYVTIARSFPVGTAARGVMGSLPVFCFALCGALAPRLARRIGLGPSLALALVLVCLGQLGRAYLSHSIVIFGLLSALAFGGVGFGNVLVPPAIRHYLPQRISQMMGIYLACVIVGASVPSLIAVPVANAIGWRSSLGVWGLFALVGLFPWLGLLHAPGGLVHARGAKLAVWRSATTWAVTALFFVGGLVTFTLIEWLPPLLKSTDNASRATAGVLLALLTLVAFPISLFGPGMLARMRKPYLLVGGVAVCAVVGPLGLVLVPRIPWVWVVVSGIGGNLISLGMALVNLRTRTEEGAESLSGFMQGLGYLIAGVGPIMVGVLHAAVNEWVVPFVFVSAVGLVALFAGVIAVRPITIEDELASRLLPEAAADAQTDQGAGA